MNEAKAEPVGLALLCNSATDADLAKRNLYVARANARKEGNTTFDSLSISMSPHSDEILYIYEREVKDAEGIDEAAEASNGEDLSG